MRAYAFGANAGLVPGAPAVLAPTHIADGVERIVFHSWDGAILSTCNGVIALGGCPRVSGTVVAQHDAVAGTLRDGVLELLQASARASGTRWDAVAATDAGPVLASGNGGVYAFPSLSALAESRAGERLAHPLLNGPASVVVGTESRAFVLVRGHVLEAVWDWRGFKTGAGAGEGGPSPAYVPALHVLDDLVGLDVRSLVPGRGNRVVAITAAGEGYVLEPGTRGGDVVRLDLDLGLAEDEGGYENEEMGVGLDDDLYSDDDGGDDDDDRREGHAQASHNGPPAPSPPSLRLALARLADEEVTRAAPGPDFDLVIVAGELWARGNNAFGQLGQGHYRPTRGWVRVPLPSRARDVSAARFGGIVLVDDGDERGQRGEEGS